MNYKTEDGAYLGTVDTARGWAIAWWHEGEDGLCLGENFPSADHETQVAQAAIFEAGLAPERDALMRLWLWDSKKAAFASLRVANAALVAAESDKPWPDWAQKALAHGWKPPKGWKP